MPKVYHDRFARTSAVIYRITADEVELAAPHGSSPVKSLPRHLVCKMGRVFGEQRTYAYADMEGPTKGLTSAECRALADALLAAADILEGKRP